MAESICFKLLIQAFLLTVVLVLMKLGSATAANRPMIATTTIISTSVKPDFAGVLKFIIRLVLS